MNAVEVESAMTALGQITLPAEIAEEVPMGEQLRVVVMWDAASQNDEWRSDSLMAVLCRAFRAEAAGT
jgi:bifunctional DNA-binding transcriptional regulator/antitoxin component of YhaV-PrlF toxin-antitoxin module